MSVLVIGSLQDFLSGATTLLQERGHHLRYVASVEDGLQALKKGLKVQTILVEFRESIERLMAWAKKGSSFQGKVIACSTGTLDKQRVRSVLEMGIHDFIPFPPDPHMIADIFDHFHQARGRDTLLFQDPVMGDIVAMADKIAVSDASVLITGESGTGKEVMARHIHVKSNRSKKRFVSVNCAAIPDNLLESELFGHEKGAFTGAIATRIGKFEEASGGTLLLDEISEMEPRLQAKLLRAIQERQIDRVGGKGSIPVDFRLISTSNRHMKEAIRAGSFREDLFFRISVVHLHLPPLRDRPGDLKILTEKFLAHYAQVNHLDPVPAFSPECLDLIHTYDWPGNVRQLENAVHRGVLLCEGPIILPKNLGLMADETPTSALGQGLKNPGSNDISSESFSKRKQQ